MHCHNNGGGGQFSRPTAHETGSLVTLQESFQQARKVIRHKRDQEPYDIFSKKSLGEPTLSVSWDLAI